MAEVIAEVGINANGNIGVAKQLIDVAHTSGCKYVKFQKRTVEKVYSEEELNTPRISDWGATNREQKHGLEFDLVDYMQIEDYCKPRIPWFASPWDLSSLDFVASFNVPFIKIPSALITNEELLERCKNFDIPVILSTGMSTIPMIDRAIDILGRKRIDCIMHCTSTYPSKTEELNLGVIPILKERYPWTRIGFSNHHTGLVYMPIAAALGAELIECHITLDRSMYGSDQGASIEPEGLHKLNKWLSGVNAAMGDGVKRIYDSEVPIIKKLRR